MSFTHRRLAEQRRMMRHGPRRHHFLGDLTMEAQGAANDEGDADDGDRGVDHRLEFILAAGTNAENGLEWFEIRRSQRPKPRYSYGNSFEEWIRREQTDFQLHLGHTKWNLNRSSVYLHHFGPPQAERLMLKRVRACIGWAIHGLVLEFLDGTRLGYVSDVSSIHDDQGIDRRRPTPWVDIQPGDYVRSVRGSDLSRNCFLCHSVHFEMASGRTISFESSHEPWRGKAFKYDLPEGALLQYVSCREGRCIGLTGVETSMHLPIKSIQRVQTLPKPCRERYKFLQLVSHRVEANLEKIGLKPLGRDLWGSIICDYLSCYDLQDHESSALGRLLNKRSSSSSSEEEKEEAAQPEKQANLAREREVTDMES